MCTITHPYQQIHFLTLLMHKSCTFFWHYITHKLHEPTTTTTNLFYFTSNVKHNNKCKCITRLLLFYYHNQLHKICYSVAHSHTDLTAYVTTQHQHNKAAHTAGSSRLLPRIALSFCALAHQCSRTCTPHTSTRTHPRATLHRTCVTHKRITHTHTASRTDARASRIPFNCALCKLRPFMSPPLSPRITLSTYHSPPQARHQDVLCVHQHHITFLTTI